jgi:hypothetical protein
MRDGCLEITNKALELSQKGLTQQGPAVKR